MKRERLSRRGDYQPFLLHTPISEAPNPCPPIEVSIDLLETSIANTCHQPLSDSDPSEAKPMRHAAAHLEGTTGAAGQLTGIGRDNASGSKNSVLKDDMRLSAFDLAVTNRRATKKGQHVKCSPVVAHPTYQSLISPESSEPA